MRIFLALILFTIGTAFAGTCTTTTRTNYSTGQVLTSSALNTDFNQLVTKVNALDGGCISDGTVESTALDSSLDAVKNGIHQGCGLSYSDANTISVGRCILSLGGNFVKTTAATTVTWGCSGCSAEANSTQYYLYAKSTSTGTTLNLLISTTAPGADGFDISGNKVLGKFYNGAPGAAGDIYTSSIYSWADNNYFRSYDSNASSAIDKFTFYYGDGAGSFGTVCNKGVGVSCTTLKQSGNYVTSVTGSLAAGNYDINFAKSYKLIICTGNAYIGLLTPASINGFMIAENASAITLRTGQTVSPYTEANSFGQITCEGY